MVLSLDYDSTVILQCILHRDNEGNEAEILHLVCCQLRLCFLAFLYVKIIQIRRPRSRIAALRLLSSRSEAETPPLRAGVAVNHNRVAVGVFDVAAVHPAVMDVVHQSDCTTPPETPQVPYVAVGTKLADTNRHTVSEDVKTFDINVALALHQKGEGHTIVALERGPAAVAFDNDGLAFFAAVGKDDPFVAVIARRHQDGITCLSYLGGVGYRPPGRLLRAGAESRLPGRPWH